MYYKEVTKPELCWFCFVSCLRCG